MIAVIQRVTAAKVSVDGAVVGQIGAGLVVLAAVHAGDTREDVAWLAGKLAGLRIFRNGDKYFDWDVRQVGGGILLVSNFTVAAETAKGRRPSLSPAAGPEVGRELFAALVDATRVAVGEGVPVETGVFQAEMAVSIENDGPVTFILDSRQRGSVIPAG